MYYKNNKKDYIAPFAGDDPEYCYFSMSRITKDLPITLRVFEEAKQVAASSHIIPADTELWYDSSGSLNLSLTMNIANKVNVALIVDKDNVVRLSASDSKYLSSGIWRGYCYNEMNKYEVAVLILLNDYIKEYNPGDTTDLSAIRFLSSFGRNKAIAAANRSPDITLNPVLAAEKGLRLKLTVTAKDIGRSYVVKDIKELMKIYRSGGLYQLGKKNQLDLSRQCFDENSTALAELVNRFISENERLNSNVTKLSNVVIPEEIKGDISLSGERLDSFYEMYRGQRVAANTAGSKYYLLKEHDPAIKMNITQIVNDNGQFEGINAEAILPAVFYGRTDVYCVTGDRFCRIGRDYYNNLQPFLTASRKDNIFSMKVGRKKLSEFYYSVLPELRTFVQVSEPDSAEIEKFLPPEVFFRFYLDIYEGIPECRVETRYGETGVAIFDLLESTNLKDDFRDANREIDVLETVLKYFPVFERQNERFITENADDDTIYEIINDAVPVLMSLGDVCCTDRFQNINHIRSKTGITVGVSIKSDIMELNIISDDISNNELLDIIKSYRQKKKYHRLKNGEFIDLDDSIAELASMLEALHISPKEFVKGKMNIPAYRALYLDKMLENTQDIYAKRDSHFKALIKNFKTVTDSDFEIPETLVNVMRGYQTYGHKWLRTLESCGFGGILADDMGLGKTLQMISVLLAAKNEGKEGTSLIVCPTSLVYNWLSEFQKFAPGLNVCTVAGNAGERAAQIEAYKSYDVLVTSYDLLKRDSANYDGCEFVFQVLDEAQFIKNHNTAAAKAVKTIKAAHKFALTGTPIENRLSELWSIFDFLMPGFLYSYDSFKKEFELPIVKHSDEEASKRLNRMTSPFILRRLKANVLRDLPEKVEESYVVRFEEEQQHIYDAKVLELKQYLDSENDEAYRSDKLKALAMLTQIRQVCCDPSLIFENYSGGSAKLSACMDIVERAMEGGHRMLIFSQFTSMLELIEKRLDEENISYYKITGETPKKKRTELVDSFNSGDTPVFLISLKAGGTGLNLTGADVVIHYDPWWNVAAQNQATDRAHRIGQKKSVTVYKLITQNTIEEKIQKMQINKQKLAESVLSGDNVSLSSLSKDELMELLG